MNIKIRCVIILAGMFFEIAATEDFIMNRRQMTEALRAGENIAGQTVRIPVVYKGLQIDHEGGRHHLFESRGEDTLYLCYFDSPQQAREKGRESLVSGRIIRVELHDRDFRDNRIYALWLDILSVEQ